MKRFLPAVLALSAIANPSGWALAEGEERPAVQKGIQFIKSQVSGMSPGVAGLASLAMIKAEVPANDPALRDCMARFSSTFNGTSYKPAQVGGLDNYEAAVVSMALVNIDPIAYKPLFAACTQYLISKQNANGSWDYSHRTTGDTSMSQYALLALWEAENAGIDIPPSVWDRAASWLVSSQSGAGGWTYHRDESQYIDTISMTAAGVGSLILCQKQLARHRKGQDLVNPLMSPLTIDGQDANSRYKVTTTAASINAAVRNGNDWIAGRFQVNTSATMGQSPYYGLYGIERMAALAKDEKINLGFDWYGKGLPFVLSTQQTNGSWNSQHDSVPNTCWAILFSTKSTQKSLRKIEIRRLGAGTLRGGRGLPSDMSNMEIVQGQLVVRPMGGAIEGMLAVLENNRADNADAALAGLVSQYEAKGPSVLRPMKDRFRKLLGDRDPSIRRIAVWGLGRTADLDVAPILIKTLMDPDDDMVSEARIGLQVLSRKLDGFGPARGASPDQKQDSARRWQEWYQAAKPPDLDAPDLLVPTATAKPAPATPPPAQ